MTASHPTEPNAMRTADDGYGARPCEKKIAASHWAIYCRCRKETIAGMHRNGRDAPVPAIPVAAMEPRVGPAREIWGARRIVRLPTKQPSAPDRRRADR